MKHPIENQTDLIGSYISEFPEEIQKKLNQLREIIKQAAPEAREIISYGMPAYYQFGNLVYFAAHKNHIGFYPTAEAIESFVAYLTDYKCSKGTIQFPFHEPLPVDLITKIVQFRVASNTSKAKNR